MDKEEAVKRINQILEELEKSTGQIVKSIDVIGFDCTTLSDTNRQMMRTAVITLEPTPGSNWGPQ
jgi:hypothetical protein